MEQLALGDDVLDLHVVRIGFGLESGLGLAVEHSAKELAPDSAIPGELPPRLGLERGLGLG